MEPRFVAGEVMALTLDRFTRSIFHAIRLKWSIDVLNELAAGPARHGDLQVAIEVARRTKVHTNTLDKALARLQRFKYVQHHTDTEPSVYELTRTGRMVAEKLQEMDDWCRDSLHSDRD